MRNCLSFLLLLFSLSPILANDQYRTLPIDDAEKPDIPAMSERYPIALDIYNTTGNVPAANEAINFGEVTIIVDGVNLNQTIESWQDGSRPKPALLRVPYQCPDTSAADCNTTAHNAGYVDKTFTDMVGIMNAMGLELVYQHEINGVEVRKITATSDNLKLEAWVGSRIAFLYMNNQLVRIINQEYAPFVTMQGKTMILLSLVADALAAKIEWDNNTKTATITSRTNYFYHYKDHNHYTSATYDYAATPNTNGASIAGIVDTFKENRELFDVPFENHDLAGYGLFPQMGGYSQEAAHVRSEEVFAPFVLSARRQTDTMVRPLYLMLPEQIRRETAFILPDRLAQNPEAYLPYLEGKSKAVVVGSFGGAGQITGVNHADYTKMKTRHNREFFKLKLTLDLLTAMGLEIQEVLYAMGDTSTAFGSQIRAQNEVQFTQILNQRGIPVPSPALSWGADEMMVMAFAKLLPPMKVYVHTSNPAARHHYDALKTSSEVMVEKLAMLNLTQVSNPSQADLELYVLTREPGVEAALAPATQILHPNDEGGRGIGALRHFFSSNRGFGPITADQLPYFKPYMLNPETDDPEWVTISYDKVMAAQANHDTQFRSMLEALPEHRRKRSIICDARLFNGSWDEKSVPRGTADWLVFSGWGTFANNIGMAAGTGKILHYARQNVATDFNMDLTIERMYLEAVAHDVYGNGYRWGQKLQPGSFAQKVTNAGIAFNHHRGYTTLGETASVFSILTNHVSAGMQDLYQGTGLVPESGTPFKFTAQFWRTFESEVHLWDSRYDDALFVPGLYRKMNSNQGRWYLDPTDRKVNYPNMTVTAISLDYLINEF